MPPIEKAGGQARRHDRWKGYFFIAAAAFFWGGSAALGKAFFTGRLAGAHAGQPRLDPLILAQTRTTFSLILLAPLVLIFGKKSKDRMTRSDFALCLLIGVLGLAASNYFYYLAIDKTSVATAIILQYTAPVWVLLYMVARGLQKATITRTLSVGLAVFGCAMAVGSIALLPHPHLMGLKLNSSGVIAAQLAAISFAFYNVAGHNVLLRQSQVLVITYSLLGAAIFWMIINPPWRVLAVGYSVEQWLFLLLFAVLSMLLPFSCYLAGLRYLDATRAIVTSCLEPVSAILFAAAFVNESVTGAQIFGMALVLAAIILAQAQEKQKETKRSIIPNE